MTDAAVKLRSRCVQIYILYIAAVFLSLVPSYAIGALALVSGVLGIVMAYGSRKMMEGTLYASHIRWLIRTFWIGGAVLLPIATVIFTIVIYFWGDMTSIARLSEQVMANGGVFTEDQVMATKIQYIRDNMRLFIIAGLPTLGPAMLWWLVRSFKGLNLVHKDEPIDRPEAFVWAG